ncbi:TetR/AcrR family transcriptional regulator [Microbacterium telephonicum]|uniref:TetR family transcriptional regulator n=1 Tax=Microbacterium telephonicum TaxID=1714841 RepID=A0A498CIX1_9MICO|nr:helix-turn-helix domain-containing protein [Microbacterium telephonicum]RLK52168.1 TetR family transcriptional regulator [Microbacterium telephonicum]
MSDASRSRPYRSALRTEQARRTRRRILEAAGELFAAGGFQATTLAAIARSAGVSAETVKNAGTKAELLIGAFEVVFAGEEGAGSLSATAAADGVLSLPDEEFLAATAATIAAANARSSRLWTVLLGASLSDSQVDAALSGMLAHRRADYRLLASELHRRRVIDDGAGIDDLAARLSFLMSPESHQQLVVQSGWTTARYHDWIMRALTGR